MWSKLLFQYPESCLLVIAPIDAYIRTCYCYNCDSNPTRAQKSALDAIEILKHSQFKAPFRPIQISIINNYDTLLIPCEFTYLTYPWDVARWNEIEYRSLGERMTRVMPVGYKLNQGRCPDTWYAEWDKSGRSCRYRILSEATTRFKALYVILVDSLLIPELLDLVLYYEITYD
jgi:hypothetical protein